MTKRLLTLALLSLAVSPVRAGSPAPLLRSTGPAEVFARGRVSSEFSEVKAALSPDGTRVVWGSMNRPGGPGGWDLWESRKEGAAWSAPSAVPFCSPKNDFDPSFAPDGSGVYFFSNRPGGSGGDDLWFAPLDSSSGQYGSARNLGPRVNSPGDEWAPVVSPDGSTLLFATDGRPGAGLHDLFVSRLVDGTWREPLPLPIVNGPDEDFDATYLDDGRSLVFTRRTKDQDGADLWLAAWHDGRYAPPRRLGPEVNTEKGWNLGPSTTAAEPGVLYFSSHRPDDTAGRLDIYRIGYRLVTVPADATDLPDREPRPALPKKTVDRP